VGLTDEEAERMLREASEQFQAKATATLPIGEAATIQCDTELDVVLLTKPIRENWPPADLGSAEDRRRARAELDREANERLAAERAAKQREVLLAASGIPPLYAEVSLFRMPAAFGKLPKPEVLERMEVAKQIREGLLTARAPWLLYGPRGNGKTAFACGAVRMFCEFGRSARYATARDYVGERRDTWGTKRSEDAVLEAWVKPDLIVIDEYQEKFPDVRSDGDLVELIDKRYAAMKPTLLLTNLSREAFSQVAGASVDDRLADGVVIACPWKSLRGRLAAARPDAA
jgi:DNA replication protein DnaC